MRSLECMDYDRLVMMTKLTQLDADAHQQRYSHNHKGHPGRRKAAQLQAEAAVLRREIKRRKREGRSN